MSDPSVAENPRTLRTVSGGAVTFALGTVYLLWGGTYLGNKVALESIPPLTLTSSRFLVAGALLLSAAHLLGRGAWPGLVRVGSAGLTGLLLVGAGSTLLALGQQRVDSGLASLLIASMPLWALAIGLFLGSRPSRTASIGIFGGFVGLVLLVGASAVGSTATVGVLLLLMSTFCWACGSTVAQRVHLPEDPLVSSGWQMLIGGAVVAMVAGVGGEAGALGDLLLTDRSVVAWLTLTFLSTAIGFSAYAWLLQNASMRLATSYAYVNPVVAIVLGAIVLGERLAWSQIPGAVLILVAVALVVAAERTTPDTSPVALPPSLAVEQLALGDHTPARGPSSAAVCLTGDAVTHHRGGGDT